MMNWSWTQWVTGKRRCSSLCRDTDTTFNFVIAMLQSQLFNLLCDKADDVL